MKLSEIAKRLNMKIDKVSPEAFDMMEEKVSCPNCKWKGKLKKCGTDWESEGWEYPEYQIATCPKCGEAVDF